jgi:hypothetical protein
MTLSLQTPGMDRCTSMQAVDECKCVRRYIGLVFPLLYSRSTSFDVKSTAFPYDMIYRLIIHQTYTDWVPDDPKTF